MTNPTAELTEIAEAARGCSMQIERPFAQATLTVYASSIALQRGEG